MQTVQHLLVQKLVQCFHIVSVSELEFIYRLNVGISKYCTALRQTIHVCMHQTATRFIDVYSQ